METIKTIFNDQELKKEIVEKLDSDTFPYSPESDLSDKHIRNYVSMSLKQSFKDMSDERKSVTYAIIKKEINEFGGFVRPVLLVQDDDFVVPVSEVFAQRLKDYRTNIQAAIRASGRIEAIEKSGKIEPLDTACLIAPDIVATNYHVAEIFAKKKGKKDFVFQDRYRGAIIDFKVEHEKEKRLQFAVTEILYLQDNYKPDLALFRVELHNTEGNKLPVPMNLAFRDAITNQDVCIIGYPQKDEKYPDQAFMHKLFKGIDGIKRIAPGQVMDVGPDIFTHDCSSLGGNSGSPIFSYRTGEAVGIHRSGLDGQQNSAIPASVIAKKLSGI